MLQGRESLLLGSFFHFPEGRNNSESEGCIYKVIQPRTSACLDAKYGSSPRENTPVLWLGASQAMPGSCTYRLRCCLTPNPPCTRGDGDEERRARRGLSSLIATAATKSKSIRGFAFATHAIGFSSDTCSCQLQSRLFPHGLLKQTSTTAVAASTRCDTSWNVLGLCACSHCRAIIWSLCASHLPLFGKQTRNKLLLSLHCKAHLSL